MKNVFIYIAFFVYSLSVLKPVMPTIADTLAHVFWYSRHLATVHAENGRYHVHLEYARAGKANLPEKQTTPEPGNVVYVAPERFPRLVSPARRLTAVRFPDYSDTLPAYQGSSCWQPPRA